MGRVPRTRASPVSDRYDGRRRDKHGIVHRVVSIGKGFGEMRMTMCSSGNPDDMEYEDEDVVITCLQCLGTKEWW